MRVRHKGNGRCLNCHDKHRAKNPKRKEQLKANLERWYEKVKGTDKYKEYTNRRAKVYRDTSNAYRGFLQRQYRKGRAKRKVLNKQNRRSWKSGVMYTCDCCGEKVRTPYTSEYLEDNFNEFLDFKKFTEQLHKGLL
jgi:predicted CXXCH cytochrome family protein